MAAIVGDYNVDNEKILCYPVISIPISLCHFDGTICKTEKSAIVKVFEKVTNLETHLRILIL
jgi:hypothetical protein